MPPLQDFGEWVYQGWLGAHLLQGDAAVADRFAVVRYPVPNELAQGLLTLLSTGMNSLLAAKVFLAGLIASSAWVCWMAARRLQPETPGIAALLLYVCVFANTNLWNGYVGYQLSILLLLVYLLQRERLGALWVGAFGAVIFFAHASTFAAYVLIVVIFTLAEKRSTIRLAALLPGAMLLAWYTLVRRSSKAEADLAGPKYTNPFQQMQYKGYTLAKAGPFQNLVDAHQHSLATRSHALYLAGVALNFFFAMVLLWALGWALYRLKPAQRRKPLLLASAISFAVFLAMPNSAFGVVNLGERFYYPALLFMFLALPQLPLRTLLAGLVAAGAALTAGQFLFMPAQFPDSAVAYPVDRALGAVAKPAKYGLFSHDLYVDDDRRYFLQAPQLRSLPPLAFDTSLIVPVR